MQKHFHMKAIKNKHISKTSNESFNVSVISVKPINTHCCSKVESFRNVLVFERQAYFITSNRSETQHSRL